MMARYVSFPWHIASRSNNANHVQARALHTMSRLQKKVSLTDYEVDEEGVQRVSKIPSIKGFDILRTPKLNKGVGFTITERQMLGIHGLLPPAVFTQKVQMERSIKRIRMLQTDLQKYVALNQIGQRNERLFYKLMMEYTEELLPIVYTPTVGKACQQYGLIFRDPKGLFITKHDLGNVYKVVKNWPERRVQAVVMTDGERILGLGDLGCNGIGISVGKLALYTACGGIHPSACLPIMIDVGTNNERLLNDPLYIGLRERRLTSEKYDELIEEIIAALRKRFGANVLIQFEDFAGHNSSRLLEKFRDECCTFNDDIQGTASVALGGLLTSLRISGMQLKDHKFLFLGAGAAATGIAHLIVRALVKGGLTEKEAAANIFMFDQYGLLTKSRGDEITPSQMLFAHDLAPSEDLVATLKQYEVTSLFGVSGAGGAFTEEVCRQMTSNCDRPLIFALSNPTKCAECTAEQAYMWTDGKCIFASGSPFDPVTLADGRTLVPGQGNNVYIFPGLALGVIASQSSRIPEDMFLTAAETLAELVSEEDLAQGRVYPPLSNIKEVSIQMALRIVDLAFEKGIANVVPMPEDREALVRSILYRPEYVSNVPMTFEYPHDHAEIDTDMDDVPYHV